jgi:phosphoglycolate phosphatase-like HAD superfamily hydrolase
MTVADAARPLGLLFDIDGTLVSTGGAGRFAVERAFAEHYGRPDAFAGIGFGGMTDHAIVRAGCEAIGREYTATDAERVLATYVGLLREELARVGAAHRLHRGIAEALDRAAVRPRTAIGLGTGNIRAGAEAKLAPLGVYERFGFGGFGSDHELRAELLRIGAVRGAAALGVAVSECRVVIIGDTPKDVAAALAISAEVLGVGTGGDAPEQLRACGAHAVCADMSDEAALAWLLR